MRKVEAAFTAKTIKRFDKILETIWHVKIDLIFKVVLFAFVNDFSALEYNLQSLVDIKGT